MRRLNKKIRLYVSEDLSPDRNVILSRQKSHYIKRVMRRIMGDEALLFNGRDGEWVARISDLSGDFCSMELIQQERMQKAEPEVWLVFAPIKKSRLDFMVEKATELGVTRLLPVITERTEVNRVNTRRLLATSVEAAEQCGRLSVPEMADPIFFDKFIESWQVDRRIYLMDETQGGLPVIEAFLPRVGRVTGSELDVAIFVGPEGGFSPTELDVLRKLPFVRTVSLGPRILRAETAAVIAMGYWQMFVDAGCLVHNR